MLPAAAHQYIQLQALRGWVLLAMRIEEDNEDCIDRFKTACGGLESILNAQEAGESVPVELEKELLRALEAMYDVSHNQLAVAYVWRVYFVV